MLRSTMLNDTGPKRWLRLNKPLYMQETDFFDRTRSRFSKGLFIWAEVISVAEKTFRQVQFKIYLRAILLPLMHNAIKHNND